MNASRILVGAALVAGAGAAEAQQRSRDSTTRFTGQPSGEFVVKTVPLHHLTSADAVKLLKPNVQTVGAGVFAAPANIRAVTIREVPRIFSEMTSVLNEYDREAATITLNFQIISADHSMTRDASAAGLDSLLRGVLRYSGYHLLGTTVAPAAEGSHITQTLNAGEPLSLAVDVSDIRVEGNDASVHLNVNLSREIPSYATASNRVTMLNPTLLSTGVTVPIGQTVVLGTSAAQNGQRALILTVRPQIAAKR
jgi:hypothetical protein